MRRGRQVGAVTAIVAVLAVSVVLALPSDDRQGGSAPALTSPQDVMAESGGVTLAISGAEFSGTATFIELAARVAGAARGSGKWWRWLRRASRTLRSRWRPGLARAR